MNPPQPTDALFAAIDTGDIQTVTDLLDQGEDINTHDSNNETLLMRATLAEQDHLVSLLLERGADPTLENEGVTAMYIATLNGESKDNPTYQILFQYWKTRYKNSQPIPPDQARIFLTVYSDTEPHHAFCLKNGQFREGYMTVEEEEDAITFSWAPSPLSYPAGWDDDDEEIIPFSEINLDSLYW